MTPGSPSRLHAVDPAVARLDELDRELLVRVVRIDAGRQRRPREVLERHEEAHCGVVIGDDVLQEEEVHVAAERTEQPEVGVPRERVAERTGLVEVVPRMHSTVRSNRSLILGWRPRAPLIVIWRPTRLPGKIIMPPIV